MLKSAADISCGTWRWYEGERQAVRLDGASSFQGSSGYDWGKCYVSTWRRGTFGLYVIFRGFLFAWPKSIWMFRSFGHLIPKEMVYSLLLAMLRPFKGQNSIIITAVISGTNWETFWFWLIVHILRLRLSCGYPHVFVFTMSRRQVQFDICLYTASKIPSNLRRHNSSYVSSMRESNFSIRICLVEYSPEILNLSNHLILPRFLPEMGKL